MCFVLCVLIVLCCVLYCIVCFTNTHTPCTSHIHPPKPPSPAYTQVTTEQQRTTFLTALNDAEDWLYGDGDSASAPAFKEKLKQLTAIGEPIEQRVVESVQRPKVVEEASKWIEITKLVRDGYPVGLVCTYIRDQVNLLGWKVLCSQQQNHLLVLPYNNIMVLLCQHHPRMSTIPSTDHQHMGDHQALDQRHRQDHSLGKSASIQHMACRGSGCTKCTCCT